jgi:hypothetical protein
MARPRGLQEFFRSQQVLVFLFRIIAIPCMGQVDQGIDTAEPVISGEGLPRRRLVKGPVKMADERIVAGYDWAAAEGRDPVTLPADQGDKPRADVTGSSRDHQMKRRHNDGECKRQEQTSTTPTRKVMEADQYHDRFSPA